MCRQNLAEKERERENGEVVQVVVLSTTDNYLHRVERDGNGRMCDLMNLVCARRRERS